MHCCGRNTNARVFSSTRRLSGRVLLLAMFVAASSDRPLSADRVPEDARNQVATRSEPVAIVRVDAAHPDAAFQPVWNYFGADEPNYVYAAHGRQLLRELAAMSPEPVYVRLHNLLTSGDGTASLKWGSTGVYTEDADGTCHFHWEITDRIFDALVASGARPLVEVGFMPEALSTHPQPYRHTFPAGPVFTGWSYPPTDEAKWSALVMAWVTHLRSRYGEQAERDWLWEVWNEPDIDYWHGTPEQYNRLYDISAAAIRRVLPHAQVGGPEVTGVHSGWSEAFLRQFLEHCQGGVNAATAGKGAPLDFISFHPKGAPKFVDGHVEMGMREQLRATERGMQVVASYPHWRGTPIILGESDPEGCAACAAPQNGYRNTTLYGVSILEAVARQKELARQLGVTLRGAVNWSFEFEDQPLFANLRSLATDGIDKPVLGDLRLLAMLHGRQLPLTNSAALPLSAVLGDGVRGMPDLGAIATQPGPREIDVLLWNYHDVDVPRDAMEVQLDVAGVDAARTLRGEQFRVDAGHANAFTAWQSLGSPGLLTAGQRAELQKAAVLSAEPVRSLARSPQGASLRLSLPPQAATLVRLTWR